MSKRLKIVIAAVAGLLAAIIALGYLRSREQQLIAMAQPQRVVVARTDMAPGRVISADDVRLMEVPTRYVQPGHFTDVNEVVDRIVVAGLLEGEQVTASKVAFAEAEPLAAKLPPGRRGVTLAVNPVTGVAGLVRPGDSVDVVGIFQLGRSAAERVTQARFLLQQVLVAAIDQDTGGVQPRQEGEGLAGPGATAPQAARTVTLALSPEDSQRLVLAQELGQLFLLLRSGRETEGELAFEILDAQKLLDSELPVWTEAMEEAEFRRQLLRQRP